jgi:hypothetical protein
MGQPVKLSDALVLEARIAGDAQERSIAGQVEYWATLGKSVELLLNGKQVQALRGADVAEKLAHAIRTAESPEGRSRVAAVLAQRPFPHFEQIPGRSEMLLRIDEDGSKAIGRFVNRTFVCEQPSAAEAGERRVQVIEQTGRKSSARRVARRRSETVAVRKPAGKSA